MDSNTLEETMSTLTCHFIGLLGDQGRWQVVGTLRRDLLSCAVVCPCNCFCFSLYSLSCTSFQLSASYKRNFETETASIHIRLLKETIKYMFFSIQNYKVNTALLRSWWHDSSKRNANTLAKMKYSFLTHYKSCRLNIDHKHLTSKEDANPLKLYKVFIKKLLIILIKFSRTLNRYFVCNQLYSFNPFIN